MFFFLNPGIVKKYTFAKPQADAGDSDKWNLFRKTILKGLSADEFQTEQVWYTSKDGTRVPMFIVKHKDTKLDGTAPAIQYGMPYEGPMNTL